MHRMRSVLQRQRVVTASPEASALEVAETMARHGIGAIPILDGEDLVGIFSERDLMTRVVVAGRDPAKTSVSEVMTREVVTAGLEDHVEFCIEKMKRVGCRHLPVMVAGKLIGIVSMRDLLRDELVEQDHEIQSLKAYLHQEPI